jgi:hypothetical protein
MKRHPIVIALAVGFLTLPANAQVPQTMSYQGILTDPGGNPVPDGNVGLTFRLFDIAAGGTPLWQETQQVTVSKGIFSAILGTGTPLNLPFDKPYWMGITVAQGTELVPRVALTASPYSMIARVTMAEPGIGQGITIRNLAGEATHVLHQNGDVSHKGKTRLESLLRVSISAPDTALVVGTTDNPALVFVVRQAVQGEGHAQSHGRMRGSPGKSTGVADELIGGDLTLFGGDLIFVNAGSHETVTTVGLDGLSTSGKVEAGGDVSTSGNVSARGLYIVSGLRDTMTIFRPDGTSYHKGLGTFEGGVTISGSGKGILFPDGTFQGTAVSPGNAFTGVLQGKALVVKNSAGVEVFRVDTTGTSLHKGDETFEGDVILKGQGGMGIKLVDAAGRTLAGFGRIDSSTNRRMGVYGKTEQAGDLAGVFDGDVEIDGGVYATSLHIVRAPGDTVVHFNDDGTSEHKGLETYRAGLQTVLTNGNILRMNPAEGLTLKTAGGQFRGHMDPSGNGLFAGNVGVAGNLNIGGTLSKAGGSFKIDHPLDPANKYLYHSFVESPDMKNMYDGVVVLDAQGVGVVTLPIWFDALNRDFRYQLTAIGVPGPNLFISQKINENQFTVAGGTPGMEVSWQVTGTRKDAYAEKHRIPVEEKKPVAERGRFLYPDVFGLSRDRGISFVSEAGSK